MGSCFYYMFCCCCFAARDSKYSKKRFQNRFNNWLRKDGKVQDLSEDLYELMI